MSEKIQHIKHYSLEDFGVKRHEGVLKNGLKVVFIEKPFAPIFSEIIIRAGGIFDPIDRLGLAHFTEHIIASGSESLSKEAFSGIMESIGGYWNAFTGEEYMAVQCEVAVRDHLPKVSEYFTHALTNVYITETSLAKEKTIIISEIERARSNPKYDAHWYISKQFANGTHWNSPILGTIESVSAITVEDVQNFFSTYCCVENMVLVIAGGCTWEEVQQTFGTISFNHGTLASLPADPDIISPDTLITFEQDVPETSISIGFLAPKTNTRESELLGFVLRFAHEGITSRFYKKIRNERALAYQVSRSVVSFNTLQYTGTSVGVPTSKVPEAIEAILECYKELVEEGITQKQIDDKVDTLWFSAHRTLQESSAWVDIVDYAALYPKETPLYGSYPDIYNYRKTYTAEEVHNVLKKYITLDNYYLTLNGKAVKSYKK